MTYFATLVALFLPLFLIACSGDPYDASSTTTSTAPSITTQPSSLMVAVGSSATFVVAASGTTPFTYPWYKAGSAISGATSASYSINAVATTDAGAYYAIVSNSAG